MGLAAVINRVVRMLSTDLSTFVAIIVVLLAGIVAVIAISQWKLSDRVDRAVAFIRNENADSLSLRKMADVEATLTELLDSYDALLTSHKKLRSRIGMREVREKRKKTENGVDLGDEAEKAAYKAKLRAALRAEGRL